MSVLLNKNGASVAGTGVGVLHIESHFPLVHGHLQHARSLGIPLIYECVEGVSPRQIVACDPTVEAPLVAAARRLVGRGAKAVVGTCGSFINYHTALVQAVDVPVFSSIMAAVPLLLRALRRDAKLAVVFASVASFTERVRAEAGIGDPSRIAATDCVSLPAFQPIMENSQSLDSDALMAQVREHLAGFLAEEPGVAVIVLQCSELAPYADAIRQDFGLPVFDINSLARWVDMSLFGG